MEIENINNNTTIRHETLFGAKDIYLDETRKQENKKTRIIRNQYLRI